MQNSQRALLVLALGFGLAPLGTAWAASSGAGGTSSTSAPTTTTAAPTTNASSDFLTAKAKVTAGDYKGALPILEKIVAKDANNADAFNLLGFSNRKLGYKDKALRYYLTALKLNPSHVGANEYLGEFYLEMNDLPKAQERLAVLAKACSNCKESADLATLIADFKAKNGQS